MNNQDEINDGCRILRDGLPHWLTLNKTVLRRKCDGKLFKLTQLGDDEWKKFKRVFFSQIKLLADDGETFESTKFFKGTPNNSRQEVAAVFEDPRVNRFEGDWEL
jgi:hypothetical protein